MGLLEYNTFIPPAARIITGSNDNTVKRSVNWKDQYAITT